MRFFKAAAILAALALILTAAANAQAADKAAKKKKGDKPVNGTVVDVKKDQNNEGSITVKIKAKKKKNPNAKDEEKTFKVTATTTFEKIEGKKKEKKETPAKFDGVQKGEKVAIKAKGDKAEDVKFHVKAKKKDKKKAKAAK